MIMICNDNQIISKLKNMGFKIFKEENGIAQFFFDKSKKLNFDNETMSKIHFTNKMNF